MNYKFFYIFIFILLSHKSHSQEQVTQQKTSYKKYECHSNDIPSNPSNHYFTLRSFSNDDKKTAVNVSDVSGRVLYKFTAGKNNSVNFGDNLSAGIYFVIIQKGNKQKVIKIVKQ